MFKFIYTLVKLYLFRLTIKKSHLMKIYLLSKFLENYFTYFFSKYQKHVNLDKKIIIILF